jgi:hypothetical protein
VLDQITDVTAQAKAAIAAAGNDPLARSRALDAFDKAQVAACEAEDGFRCRLYSFSGGNTYRLFRNMEIKDVRLVYAPRAASASSAATSTTGCGRATPAISRSTAPTSARTASRPPSPATTCRTSPSTS